MHVFAPTAPTDFAAAAEQVAQQLLHQVDLLTPPVDALELAARLGMVVAHDRQQRERGRRVWLATGGRHEHTIVLGPEPRAERRQWAVAHEIGEQYAALLLREAGLDADSAARVRELAASALAARLLLPYAAFHLAGEELSWHLPAMKRRFATASHELIARRMLDMPPPVVITIFDQGRPHYRWTNLPGRLPALTPSEQAAWRLAHRERRCFDSAEEELSGGRCRRGGKMAHVGAEPAWQIARVQAWPIHEDQWQREILRMEVDEG